MTDDEKAIRGVIAKWHDATAAGDVDAILELMSDDVVFLVAGQPPMRGKAEFGDALRSLLESHRIQSTGIVQEVVVCDDIGYSWTQLKVSMSEIHGDDPPTVRTGSTLSIFRKEANGWVIARDANLLTQANQFG